LIQKKDTNYGDRTIQMSTIEDYMFPPRIEMYFHQLSQLSAEITTDFTTKAVGLFQSAVSKVPDSGHPQLSRQYV
jgi:hypothetical protein